MASRSCTRISTTGASRRRHGGRLRAARPPAASARACRCRAGPRWPTTWRRCGCELLCDGDVRRQRRRQRRARRPAARAAPLGRRDGRSRRPRWPVRAGRRRHHRHDHRRLAAAARPALADAAERHAPGGADAAHRWPEARCTTIAALPQTPGTHQERWQSGRMRRTRNPVYCYAVTRVRIPPSPPATCSRCIASSSRPGPQT